MKTMVCSAVDSNYEPISDLTWPKMERWARNLGWYFSGDQLELPDPDDAPLHPSWAKLKPISQHLVYHDYDRVVWLDADIVIYDESYQLQLPDDGFCFSMDTSGICCGAFSSTQSCYNQIMAIRSIGVCRPKFNRHEQDAFKLLIPSVIESYEVIPETVISNPETTTGKGAFAHHIWANGYQDPKDAAAAIKALIP